MLWLVRLQILGAEMTLKCYAVVPVEAVWRALMAASGGYLDLVDSWSVDGVETEEQWAVAFDI